MSLYHYTKGCHLPSIVRDGVIRTTSAGIEKKTKPAVWLTRSPEWEPTCNVGIVSNGCDMEHSSIVPPREFKITPADFTHMKNKVGMCRILISDEIQTITWAKYKWVSGVSNELYYALDEIGKEQGSPLRKWAIRFKPVISEYWECIEMFVDDQWVRWDETIPIEDFVSHCLSCNCKPNEKQDHGTQ